MTDQPERPQPERPKPQYGEYASAQEQAKIIADSFPAVSPLSVPSQTVSPVPVPNEPVPNAPVPHTPVAPASVPPVPKPAAGRRRRRWDVILTAGLLGYATINVIAQLLARDTLATIAKQFFVAQGIGDYTPTALTASLGTTLNVITLALFVITLLVTTWMLRSGRIAFWVPITGGVVATIVALVFVVILLQSDPTFVQFFDRTRR
ncbi:DUF6264 family protein [Frigoribacterium sp. CG_9.8]|uniref:DUF6264 family protein n=1 Tax=Frigoribacterium sp. CG_9.8 TaxID=2787733 RepID=UPI0018C94A34|nr:type IV secretory pathway TrbD component [Frigoribacterium sp. CG_9.8]